jgi:thiol-disulfide isomerase/thioredoxin
MRTAMRLGPALAFVALVAPLGCDANTPKAWQHAKADQAVAPSAKPTATQAAAPLPKPVPVVPKPAPTPAPSGETWGGTAIAWHGPDDGLAEAKRTGRPAVLVLYTSWCPHCKNFSNLFADARIAEASKQFVMIKANSDEAEDFAWKYAPDGGYIPRTFFLKPDGSILSDIRAGEGQYKYFYDEKDPSPLLAAMDRAKKAVAQ